jgi:hypothetical protein
VCREVCEVVFEVVYDCDADVGKHMYAARELEMKLMQRFSPTVR